MLRASRAPMPQQLSMKQRLTKWHELQGQSFVPEEELAHDMIYILQGIDGKYIKFQSNPDGPHRPVLAGLPGYEFDELEMFDGQVVVEGNVSRPTQDLIHKLAELGWLYKKVKSVMQSNEDSAHTGMVKQSLFHSFHGHFSEHYRLISILEYRLRNANPPDPHPSECPDSLPSKLDPQGGLSLKRIAVWSDDMRLRFRMMAALTDICQKMSGGALVSQIHEYTSNGDPFVRNFTNDLLEKVSEPLFHCISRWIYEGELLDPFNEFFVRLNDDLKAQERDASKSLAAGGGGLGSDYAIGGLEGALNAEADTYHIWAHKFSYCGEMLPSFLSEKYGKMVFSTGKSLNFIRYNCGDNDWAATKSLLETLSPVLKYSDITALEKSIDMAYSLANKRLFEIFFKKYRLLDHLRVLRDYVMLGRGDFVAFLMENLGPSLSRPANTLYRHNLTATLEAAMNNSASAESPPDLLRRLDARMLEFSRGEIGWDVFTLEYKVDSPIDTILDPGSMEQYLKMFHQLWRMKRVEYAVDSAWRLVLVGSKTYQNVTDLSGDFHQARIALSEMVHFIRQLQYYAQLEVIGCAWQELEEVALKQEGDLDALIDHHKKYLDRLLKKTLLLNPKSSKPETLLQQVRENLRTILQFCDALKSLRDFADTEAQRMGYTQNSNLSDDMDDRASSHPPTPKTPDPDLLPAIRKKLTKYAGTFHENTASIVASLAVHPDLVSSATPP